MFKVKIRGIYSTALTKLLFDEGFVIVQPSVTVRERFGLTENDEFPELEISDRQDRQGVQASGIAEAINAFTSILQSCLDDVIIRKGEAPATLLEGGRYMDVEFPALSKKKLDEVRGSVAPTLNGHHYYKACGIDISSALDMAEKLLEKGGPREEVEKLLQQTIEAKYPTVGSFIEIEHVKLHGNVFNLGKAVIEVFDYPQSLIQFRRVFKTKGIYDGLKIEKEPDDYAVTEAKIGEWYFKTQYFAKDGRYKGMYVNLNTPIELYPHGIRYVDLEVDVCVWPNGKVQKLDEKKLKEAAADGIITPKLVKIIKEKLQEIMRDLR
jgi:protein associated with RNAse G/E